MYRDTMSNQNPLLNTLNKSNQSLKQCLEIALNKFITIDSQIVASRTTVLDWLKSKLLDGNTTSAEQKSLLAALKTCIIASADLLLSPQLADPVLEVLLNSSQNVEVLECAEEVLKSTRFLKYFVYHIQKLADLIKCCVERTKCCNILVKENVYRYILKSVLYVTHRSLQGSELKLIFVNSLVNSIATIALDSKKRRILESDSASFPGVFYEVLFSDTEFRKLFVSNILKPSATCESELVRDVICSIKTYPTNLKPGIVPSAYSLIFHGFLLSHASPEAKLRIFVALNSFVSMSPLPIAQEIAKCVKFNENINTVNELIELLYNFDIPLDCEIHSVTFMDWLKALIDVTLDEITNNFTPAVILLLKNALAFSPLLMENCLRKFTKNVMMSKKSDPQLVKAYSELCMYVLNVHVKLNRMHKLISALLITVREHLNGYASGAVPNKFDLLPEQIFDTIQSSVTNLPSTVQNLALLNALLYHLENDCIAILEQQNSKEVESIHVLMFDIVTYLLSRFIRGTRIMDYSVPELVKDKFISLMDNLGVLLGKFGKVVISKEHVPEFVECYLHMCLVWGDMQIIFMTYESAPRKISQQTGMLGSAATNLVYLHPYLSDYHWKLIAQRVANFGNENCTNLLNDLVLQKIHALPYVEDETQGPYEENVYGDGPAVVCALYLSSQANAKWIFHHIAEFVHLLKPVDILKLSKALVNYCQTCDDEEISQILSIDFQEMRTLVQAMLNYTFHSISKTLNKSNLKELKRILRRIDYEKMVEVEMDEGDPPAESFATKLNQIGTVLSNDFHFVDERFEMDSLQKDVLILLNLPARYLRDENKILVCMLTLSLIKSLIMLHQSEVTENEMLVELSRFLQCVLSDIQLPSTVDCGKILAWFYRGLKNTPYCDATMRRLCEANRSFGSGVDSVIEIVKTADQVFIQSSAEGIDLVTSYLVNFEKTRKRKGEDTGTEVKEKLKKLYYENFDEVFRCTSESRQLREEQLALYTLLIHEALKSNDADELRLLCAHLSGFVAYVENNNESISEVISRFLLVVLQYKKTLDEYLPADFVINTWCWRWFVSDDLVLGLFLKVASVQEYKEMVSVLLGHTEGAQKSPDNQQLDLLYRVWKVVLGTSVKENKTIIKKSIVLDLCELAEKCIIVFRDNDEGLEQTLNVRKMFVRIFTAILRNTEIKLRYGTVDLCFDLISSTLTCAPTNELLTECIELLFVFCLLRRAMLLDRIPSFYLCYKSLYAEVVRRGRVNECQDVELLSSAAHKLEKLTDNLLKSRRDFMKTAISAVSDLVSIAVEVNVEGEVENHLKNIIYCWIGMCDSHGLQYLSTAMSPVTQSLFKQYWADYKKYYKFSGKV